MLRVATHNTVGAPTHCATPSPSHQRRRTIAAVVSQLLYLVIAEPSLHAVANTSNAGSGTVTYPLDRLLEVLPTTPRILD